jgi:hypothetical protein
VNIPPGSVYVGAKTRERPRGSGVTEIATKARSLWELGLVLGIYDRAEVVLKPVFGALTDRAGAKPVMADGLATPRNRAGTPHPTAGGP